MCLQLPAQDAWQTPRYFRLAVCCRRFIFLNLGIAAQLPDTGKIAEFLTSIHRFNPQEFTSAVPIHPKVPALSLLRHRAKDQVSFITPALSPTYKAPLCNPYTAYRSLSKALRQRPIFLFSHKKHPMPAGSEQRVQRAPLKQLRGRSGRGQCRMKHRFCNEKGAAPRLDGA